MLKYIPLMVSMVIIVMLTLFFKEAGKFPARIN